jgi:dATP pyrophosphohydrolase
MTITNVAKTVVYNQAGQILLLRRSQRGTNRPGERDLPGGGVEIGEDSLSAAVRETREEAGIVLRPDDLRLIYTATMLSRDKVSSVNRFVYVTTVPTDQSVTLSEEHEEYQWLSLDEVLHEFPHPVYGPALRYARDNDLLPI